MNIPPKVKEYIDEYKVGRVRLEKQFPEYNENQIRKFVQEYKGLYGDLYGSKETGRIDDLASKIVKQLRESPLDCNVDFHSPFTGKQKEVVNLILSDIHIGQKNEFVYPHNPNPVRTYDETIFIKYCENLLHGIHRLVDLLSSSYDLEHMVITMLGDLLEGDQIFKGQRFSIDGPVGHQFQLAVNAFRMVFTQLLKIFPNITVYSVPGNHGRFGRPESAPVDNNFDYLLMWVLSQTMADNQRIKFVLPKSFFYWYKIYGWTYFMHHGSDIYSWMGLPYYGISRKSKAAGNEFKFERELIGHFHTCMEVPNSSTSSTLINGSWIKDSNFAWEKFRVLSMPTQRMFLVSRSRPETVSFKIDLERGKPREL